MYGKVAGTSTVITSGAGLKLLPNTGGTRIMFIVSALALTIGLIGLLISMSKALTAQGERLMYKHFY